MNVEKIYKKNCLKSFSVFGGAALSTLNLFVVKMFYYFLSTFMKNVPYIISRFFYQHYDAFVQKKWLLF